MGTQTNPFLRPGEEYIRDLDVIGNAQQDAAHYIHIQTGRPLEECLEFVKQKTEEGGDFAVKSRNLRITRRKPNGDRERSSMLFSALIKGVEKTKSILSPNMVVYDNPEKNRSFIAKFIDDKMAMRGIVKKRGFAAKQEGNKLLAAFCTNAEKCIKTLINSISGAHASPHNPHYNKTAHSSLTSTCRIASSYSNASSERLIFGNRHYRNKDVTLNNIITVTRHTNYEALSAVLKAFNMHLPTAEEAFDVVKHSTRFYWIDPVEKEEIRLFIGRLNELQRAAFVYTGDLYHIAKYNEQLVRGWIDEIIERPTTMVEDPEEVFKKANADIIALVGILCADLVAGMSHDAIKKNPEVFKVYTSTIKHVTEVFDRYKDFIQVFFVSDNLPPSIYHFPSSIRRTVVGSDTDSTMFTVQNWVEWYFGKLCFGRKPDQVAAAIMFMNTQVIAHMLAMASRFMGVEERNLFRMEMKNEYAFAVYMRANRAKHYATLITAKEGNIYAEPEVEIKGVGLKDSKVPPKIMKTLEHEIEQIMLGIVAGKGIDADLFMQKIANMEHEVFNSINRGEIEYLSSASIKTMDAYKNPMSSNYVHYDMWVNVFQEKYGPVTPPPYGAVKISNTLNTDKKFADWVNGLEPAMADRMRNWMKTNEKTGFGQFLLPREQVEKGVPKEFIPIIDARGIVSELFQGFYIVLETMGFYYRNDNITRLISDEIDYRPEYGSFIDINK